MVVFTTLPVTVLSSDAPNDRRARHCRPVTPMGNRRDDRAIDGEHVRRMSRIARTESWLGPIKASSVPRPGRRTREEEERRTLRCAVLSLRQLVGVRGFEPPAPSSRISGPYRECLIYKGFCAAG